MRRKFKTQDPTQAQHLIYPKTAIDKSTAIKKLVQTPLGWTLFPPRSSCIVRWKLLGKVTPSHRVLTTGRHMSNSDNGWVVPQNASFDQMRPQKDGSKQCWFKNCVHKWMVVKNPGPAQNLVTPSHWSVKTRRQMSSFDNRLTMLQNASSDEIAAKKAGPINDGLIAVS